MVYTHVAWYSLLTMEKSEWDSRELMVSSMGLLVLLCLTFIIVKK